MSQYRIPTLENFEWQQACDDRVTVPAGGEIKGYRYLDLSFISEKAKTVPVPKLIIDLFIWIVFFLFFNLLIYRKLEHKFALAFFSSLTVVFVAFWFV